jgi:hypothetical protein
MASKIGKEIDSWCTRCKLVLTHTIETVANGKITRVHCNTCHGQHAHRAAAPGTKTAAARPPAKSTGRSRASAASSRRADPAATLASQYASLLRGRTAAQAQPYKTTGRYKVSELIAHPTFGVGAVTGERDSVKIDVLFPDGPRVLVHGRS